MPRQPRYKGLTVVQDRILANIALGGDTHDAARVTLNILVDKGLIVRRYGEHRIFYEMPVAEHMEWCAWCAKHFPDADLSPADGRRF